MLCVEKQQKTMSLLYNQYRTSYNTIEALIVIFRPIVGIKLHFTFMLHKQPNIFSLSIKAACIMLPKDTFYFGLTKYTVNLTELKVVSLILINNRCKHIIWISQIHTLFPMFNSCQSCLCQWGVNYPNFVMSENISCWCWND